ncbi:hypothetical protein M0802_008494 [Mischocyttarus mexicanus]|nr:hypothetical protein M0802_008494 [Mischocyttarus mexicanus]
MGELWGSYGGGVVILDAQTQTVPPFCSFTNSRCPKMVKGLRSVDLAYMPPRLSFYANVPAGIRHAITRRIKMVAAANTKIPKEEEEEEEEEDEEEEEKGWMPKRPPLLCVCLYFLCLRDSLTDYPCNDEGILKLHKYHIVIVLDSNYSTPSLKTINSKQASKHFRNETKRDDEAFGYPMISWLRTSPLGSDHLE